MAEGQRGGRVAPVGLAVSVGVIVRCRRGLMVPSIGLSLFYDVHVPHGQPGPNTPGLGLRIIFCNVDSVARGTALTLCIDRRDPAVGVCADGDICNRRQSRAVVIACLSAVKEGYDHAGGRVAGDAFKAGLGDDICVAVHLEDEEALGRTRGVGAERYLIVKALVISRNAAQHAV